MVTPTSNLPLAEIESVVRQRAPQLFGQTGPVEEVGVEVHHTVYVVDCRFGSDSYRFVVKPQPREVGVGDTWQLWELHQAVRGASEFREERLVRFLGVDKEHDLVFMDYLEGTSLEELLKNGSGADREVVESALREVALVSRSLRGLETSGLPTPAARRRNGSYRTQLEEAIHSRELSRWLGGTSAEMEKNKHCSATLSGLVLGETRRRAESRGSPAKERAGAAGRSDSSDRCQLHDRQSDTDPGLFHVESGCSRDPMAQSGGSRPRLIVEKNGAGGVHTGRFGCRSVAEGPDVFLSVEARSDVSAALGTASLGRTLSCVVLQQATKELSQRMVPQPYPHLMELSLQKHTIGPGAMPPSTAGGVRWTYSCSRI